MLRCETGTGAAVQKVHAPLTSSATRAIVVRVGRRVLVSVLAVSLLLPLGSREIYAAPLGPCVNDILFHGSEKEMIGVDARWSIASVANTRAVKAFACWDWAVVHFPRKAVRDDYAPIPDTEVTVALRISAGSPQPTPSCLVDLRPETGGARGIHHTTYTQKSPALLQRFLCDFRGSK